MDWVKAFKNHYDQIFVEEWSGTVAGVLLGFLIVLIFAWGRTWGVQGGLTNWGDWFNYLIGLSKHLGISDPPESPIRNSTSLMSIGLLFGAFAAALMSRQFSIRVPPPLEMVKGVIGGTLMGIGATLSMGCNVGGFITPVTSFNMSGWGMWFGMIIGAALGIRILLWEMAHIPWGRKNLQKFSTTNTGTYKPFLGIMVYAAVIFWGGSLLTSSEEGVKFLGGVLLIGAAFGVVLHRSRFCFSRAFRDPFMIGDGSMTKGTILMLLIGILGNSLLIYNGSHAYYDALTPVFWTGSVLGGIIFGVGMIAAGGCASGSLWRAAEGHIKLWITVFFFAWTGSWWKALLVKWDILQLHLDMTRPGSYMTKLGVTLYMPKEFHSWFWTLAVSLGLLAIWFVLVVYNEATDRFTVKG
ncbi:MAG: YeeE/YedE thiosulfate transporter family protein [bacterium]